MVLAMSENVPQPNEEDPTANTAMFRAFVDEGAGSAAATTRKVSPATIAIVGAAVVLVLVVIALVAF
jgi:hypothetical protein